MREKFISLYLRPFRARRQKAAAGAPASFIVLSKAKIIGHELSMPHETRRQDESH